MSARQIRRGDVVRSKITGRTGPVLRVEQYDDGTPRITAELTKGYDTGVPGHHLELIEPAPRTPQVGDRYMYDGMLVEVTVFDGEHIEFRAIHDQDAIDRGWHPMTYGAYEASKSIGDFLRMAAPASEPEVAGPPVVSSQAGLSAIRHGVVQSDTAAAVVVAALAWEESYDQSSGTHSAIRTGHLMGAVHAHRAAIGGAS